MSESSEGSIPVVEQPKNLDIPTKREFEFNVEANNKLSDAINNKSLTTDQVLDIFENDFIPNLTTSKFSGNVDQGILIYSDLSKRIISDPNFSEKIVDITDASDQRIKDFPAIIKMQVEADDKGERGHAQYKKFPEDPRWKRYWELIEKYIQKNMEIIKTNKELLLESKGYPEETDEKTIQRVCENFNNQASDQYNVRLEEVKEKSVGKDLVSSGEWLGHGSFISSLEKMLERGGKIKSPYHLLNSGGAKEDAVGDFFKGGDTHKAFIFFFHWKKNDLQYGLDTVGRYGAFVNGQPKETDVGIFFPVDTIHRNGLTIGSYLGDKSTSEFLATKSPHLIEDTRLFTQEEILDAAKNDQTELPLDQAFFRVDNEDDYENIKSLFEKFGHDQEWIDNHIFLNQSGRDKNATNEWLESRKYAKVDGLKTEPKQVSANFWLWQPV